MLEASAPPASVPFLGAFTARPPLSVSPARADTTSQATLVPLAGAFLAVWTVWEPPHAIFAVMTTTSALPTTFATTAITPLPDASPAPPRPPAKPASATTPSVAESALLSRVPAQSLTNSCD